MIENSKKHVPTSQLLSNLVEAHSGERLSLGDFVDALGPRGFGLLCIVLSLPVCVPVPIPLGAIFGPALLVLSLQMIKGIEKPWLPNWLREKSITTENWKKLVAGSMKLLKPIEKFCKPRGKGQMGKRMEQLTGVLILLNAITLIVPIIGNNFPIGASIVIMSVAWIERDGIMLIVGMISAVFSLLWSLFVVYLAIYVGVEAVSWVKQLLFK